MSCEQRYRLGAHVIAAGGSLLDLSTTLGKAGVRASRYGAFYGGTAASWLVEPLQYLSRGLTTVSGQARDLATHLSAAGHVLREMPGDDTPKRAPSDADRRKSNPRLFPVVPDER